MVLNRLPLAAAIAIAAWTDCSLLPDLQRQASFAKTKVARSISEQNSKEEINTITTYLHYIGARVCVRMCVCVNLLGNVGCVTLPSLGEVDLALIAYVPNLATSCFTSRFNCCGRDY